MAECSGLALVPSTSSWTMAVIRLGFLPAPAPPVALITSHTPLAPPFLAVALKKSVSMAAPSFARALASASASAFIRRAARCRASNCRCWAAVGCSPTLACMACRALLRSLKACCKCDLLPLGAHGR